MSANPDQMDDTHVELAKQASTSTQEPPSGSAPRAARAARKPLPSWVTSGLIMTGSLLLGILVWHIASEQGWRGIVNFQNVPTPSEVFAALMDNIGDPEFYVHISVSVRRVFLSFFLAMVLGIPTGLIMARNRFARAFLLPYIEIFRPIPAVAWIPLAILMWPGEESSIIFITYLGAFFPIVLNTISGAEQTPEVLIRATRSLGASRFEEFRHVIFPAALPSISAGLAVGMGVAWFSLLAGEIISGQYGIGYFTWDAYSMVRTPDIVLGMLVIGLLGTASTLGVRLATKPMLRWQEKTR